MITLRKGTEEDIPTIISLAEATWPDTYGDYLTSEQIRYMLDKMYNKGELEGQFLKGYYFLIASSGGQDVGFAGFSKMDETEATYKLHKLYVLPSAHGQGIGKVLINEVVNLVKRAGGVKLALNVNRNNNAKAFYERCGFKIKETVDLEIGNGFFMNDYVMERPV